MTSSPTLTRSLSDLGASLDGRLVTPDSPDYDAMRQVFLGDIDGHPAAIARVAGTPDVVRVVDFARHAGIELAIRCGGHSGPGHSTTEGGLVLDLRDLNEISIDAATRTAWVGGGNAAIDITTAAYEHRLGLPLGDTGSVGIGGITTGGGIGYMVRRHGLTIDSLLGAEVVTADGTVHQVDAEHEPDLFWAIRGGGGNFGVVTRFHFCLHAVSQTYGGMLVLPATPETIAGFMAAAQAAPEELSAIANVMPAPPMPFLPPEAHGTLIIFAFIVHVGDLATGEAAMAPFRALATPLADMLHPMAYPEIYPPEDPNYRPAPVQRAMFLEHVDKAAATTILEFLTKSDASLRAAQLRALGGAMARVPKDATAFAHRDAPIMAVLVNFYDGTPEDKAVREAWADAFCAAMDQGHPGAYVNFLLDEGEARVHEAYPGTTWDRLASIKRRYDPDNLFHRNQNIPPAAG